MASRTAMVATGAYALYKDLSLPPYQPRMSDKLQAAYVVGQAVFIDQAKPEYWQSQNRRILEECSPQAVVARVNRALEHYQVDLRDDELALFLAQEKLLADLADPGEDLHAENLIASSFAAEYTELSERVIDESSLDDISMEKMRRKAAAAWVGQIAHTLYGGFKASFNYGAVLDADGYNFVVSEESRERFEGKVREREEWLAQRKAETSMATTRMMKHALHEIVGTHTEHAVESPTSKPPELR
ncbi:hypothetical protein [Legionella jordanis]|nr:hypothetical protein [Legionella jordanis]RMX03373.1 hypothetical protein EAW55_08140 [Legionella jordanis]RMX15851.1 hypothetical protein EAS68_11495 [Legionella jordanis]HAT8713383.1 hypothetical protein [Legionella jordanis]